MFIKSGPLATVLLVGSTLVFGGCGADSPETSVAEPVQDEAVELGTTEQAVYSGWTPYTSEELPPVGCDGSSLPKRVQCNGRYCDNIRLECEPTSGVRGESYWSGWVSDGPGTTALSCGASAWMTGISCSGSYCDNVSMQCTYMANTSPKNCFWTGWHSEETSTLTFGIGFYPRGVSCSGDFCDNMRYLVCQL